MPTEIPKQELLAKLLMMTTSSSDGEALSAIRKANNLLTAAGWTWEMLIASKIKIIENPFTNLGDPREGRVARQPPRTNPAPPPPPPPPRWTAAKTPVNSRSLSMADTWCYCCGLRIQGGNGWNFHPSNYNQHARSGAHGICDICNSTSNIYIGTHPAPHQVPPPAARPNQFPGFCYACGSQVSALQGFIFKPYQFNNAARDTWSTLCKNCNKPGLYVADHPAKHAKVFKPGILDL